MVDNALARFITYREQLEEFLSIDISESDTRSKVIDFMLINVLGWQEGDIKREGYSDAGYYDYRVSANKFAFVVEAKKGFVNFQIPITAKRAKLSTLVKGNGDIITQIRDYAVEEGLQYGIITNGKQFIVGKFVNDDGTKWKNNSCVLYNGLEDVENRFIEFYDLLSKSSVVERGGFYYQSDESKSGNRIINYINGKNEELIRNSLSGALIPTVERVFGEMFRYDELDDEELIKRCYVRNEEIKKNKSDIERLFADLPPALEEVLPVRNTENTIDQIGTEIKTYPTTLKDVPPPNPIIIIGSRGAGKSTFLNYLFKVGLTEIELDNHPNVQLDFRDYSNFDIPSNTNKICEDIIRKLYDKYSSMHLHTMKVLKRVFRKEITYNDQSVWQFVKGTDEAEYNKKLSDFLTKKLSEPLEHFIKLSEYLIRERRKRLVVVIDNADQLSIEVQKQAYLFAHSISRKSKCSIIISLREGYYYHFRHETPFNAFESNVYHITAAPYSTVLQKRMDYAIAKLDVSGVSTGGSTLFGSSTITINNDAVVDFLKGIKSVLFDGNNTEILDFLEETTYPNIREGLSLFKKFLLSGHTKVEEYVVRQAMGSTGRIQIPIWEFTSAIALENKKYYNHEYSIVKNLFYPTKGNSSHFTKVKILRYLLSLKNMDSSSDRYTLYSEVHSVFKDIGLSDNLFKDEMVELIRWGLVQTDSVIEDTNSSTFNSVLPSQALSISLKGYYYINKLMNRFSYLDLVLQDTPIYDSNKFSSLLETFPKANQNGKRSLSRRLKVTQTFIEYLKSQEKFEHVGNYDIFKGIIDDMYEQGLRYEFARVDAVLASQKRR